MKKEPSHMTEKILNLTLEIIYLLTGEIMNKSGDNITITVPPTHFLIPERRNKEKILEVTQKIIDLLTGEVPIRCQDVTVYFSMEEWEYLEGHKDLYKDVMIEDQPPLTLPDLLFRESHVLIFPSKDCLSEDTIIKINHSTTKASPQEQTKSHTLENITDTPTSCQDEEDLPRFDDSAHNTQYPSTQIREETFLAEEDFTATSHSVTQYNNFDHEVASDAFQSFERFEHQFSDSDLEDHFTVQKPVSHSAYGRPPVGRHQKPPPGRKTCTCLQCGKCFLNTSELAVHHRAHTVEKPYACMQCKKTFSRKSNLAIHVRTHTGEKPFSCAVCGKCFSSSSDCIVHQRIHTGEKPYPCFQCGRSFVSSSHRISHQRTHTGEKPHSCSLCGKCFRNRSDLHIHERTHTGERPFSCPECGKGFVCKSSLVRHQNQKLHHVELQGIDGT
ncbi:gastrula zinc finger protein XlCGF66.1-like [Lithobates pipiens]